MAKENGADDFYIGYQPQAPPAVAGFLQKWVAAALAIAALLAVVLVLGQRDFYPSVFEFGVQRQFAGVAMERPYPMLLVPRTGKDGQLANYSKYLLVSSGKFGAQAHLNGLHGQQVQLRGALIYRDGQTMIEVEDGSVEAGAGIAEVAQQWQAAGVDLGDVTLTGEIVDSKCFLGVMNPGYAKPHKACAIRCISGGMPPVFVVRQKNGPVRYFLLVGRDGRMVNKEVLDKVAEPLEISGALQRYDDIFVLRAEPASYRKLPGS